MKSQREIPYLKAECHRRGIFPPIDDPNAEQLIPIIEEHLARHQKHFGRSCDPDSGYHKEWKATNDDLERFLAELRATAKLTAPIAPPAPPTLPKASANAAPSTEHSPHKFPPADPPKNIPHENAGLSGSTIANQQPAAGLKPVSAGSMPVSGGSQPPSAGSNQPKTTSHCHSLDTAKNTADKTNDKQSDPPKEIKIEDYLQGAEAEAALDLQSYLSGRSPLDALPTNEQQAIVRLLQDYSAWKVLLVIQQPRPIGLGVKTSETALNLFARRFNGAKEEAIKDANQKALEDLIAKASNSDADFQAAIQCSIKNRLLATATNPNSDPAKINALVLSLTRLRKQVVIEQKQKPAP